MSPAQPTAPFGLSIVGTAHAAVVAALHERTVGGGWSVASVARLLDLPGAFAVLATAPDDTAPAGFALVLLAGEAADLAAIGVLPAARRGGCGRALLDAALARAAIRGATKCLLEVAADNEEAKALYLAAGFQHYGTRRAYYQRSGGTRVDAHSYVRNFGDETLGR